MNTCICCEEAGDLTGLERALDDEATYSSCGFHWILPRMISKYDLNINMPIPMIADAHQVKLCFSRLRRLVNESRNFYQMDIERFDKYMNLLTMGRFGTLTEYTTSFEKWIDTPPFYSEEKKLSTFVIKNDKYKFLIMDCLDTDCLAADGSFNTSNPDLFRLGILINDEVAITLLDSRMS